MRFLGIGLVLTSTVYAVTISKDTFLVGAANFLTDLTVNTGASLIFDNLNGQNTNNFQGDVTVDGELFIVNSGVDGPMSVVFNSNFENNGVTVLNAVNESSNPTFNFLNGNFVNSGQLFMVGNGLNAGLTMEITSQTVENTGVITYTQINGVSPGSSHFGALGVPVTNDGTICLNNVSQWQKSSVSGTGCFTVGTSSLLLVYNKDHYAFPTTQTIYLESPTSKILMDTVPQNPITVSGWGNGNTIGFLNGITGVSYDNDTLTVNTGDRAFQFVIGEGYNLDEFVQARKSIYSFGFNLADSILYPDPPPVESRPSVCKECPPIPKYVFNEELPPAVSSSESSSEVATSSTESTSSSSIETSDSSSIEGIVSSSSERSSEVATSSTESTSSSSIETSDSSSTEGIVSSSSVVYHASSSESESFSALSATSTISSNTDSSSFSASSETLSSSSEPPSSGSISELNTFTSTLSSDNFAEETETDPSSITDSASDTTTSASDTTNSTSDIEADYVAFTDSVSSLTTSSSQLPSGSVAEEVRSAEIVTDILTTIMTTTYCSDNECQETAVPATWGPVTTTLEGGVVTAYTTWCPETSFENGALTSAVTITSCSNKKCHETAVPATWGPVTTTLEGGVVTVYTTLCPVTTSSITIYETVVCNEGVCDTSTVTGFVSPTQFTFETVGVLTNGTESPAVSIAFNGAVQFGIPVLALMAIPLAILL